MIKRALTTRLPTRFGKFTLYAYENKENDVVHLALVKGDVHKSKSVLVRIHSECLTGDVFGSMRCDCGEQLEVALSAIQKEHNGILIYLRQEGRGIGLNNKLRAYQLQDEGLDTVEANLKLGFNPDHRVYDAAVTIIEDLQVSSIRLLTNNPKKLADFDGSGIQLVGRVPLQTKPNHENLKYLRTKRDRLGHILDITDLIT
ncbi:MAG: GTP cyclohydrolase II [Fidelibacterota bacterium]